MRKKAFKDYLAEPKSVLQPSDDWLDRWMNGAERREALMQVLAAQRNAVNAVEEARNWARAFERKFGDLDGFL